MITASLSFASNDVLLRIYPIILLNRVYDNPFCSLKGLLGMYGDWHDVSQWPQVPGADAIERRRLAKQEDPTTKRGIIGAFCRTYSITQAMEKFIPRSITIPSVHLRISWQAQGIIWELNAHLQVLQVNIVVLVIRCCCMIICGSQSNVVIDNLKSAAVKESCSSVSSTGKTIWEGVAASNWSDSIVGSMAVSEGGTVGM